MVSSAMLLVLLVATCGALAAKKPNIVLFLTDDQDVYSGGWNPMTQATELLSKAGATAKNWLIHTPVCCPSRAELLSGRYFHNIRNSDASGGCMHVNNSMELNSNTFLRFLHDDGYETGVFGKYLNQMPGYTPEGVDRFFANNGGSYYNCEFDQESPKKPYHCHTDEFAGYSTSVIGNKSIEWIKSAAQTGNPFMAYIAPKAPHVPSQPAPWYQSNFASESAPRLPNYNYSGVGHHWLVAQQSIITDPQEQEIDELFRNRWRTLLSVDDLIADVVAAIDTLGELDNTYFISTSDHGYNLGNLRLPMCKLNVYDWDIRIPMVIRGPGIASNSEFPYIGSNVDIGPTILSLAGLTTPARMDGRSMASLLVNADDVSVPEATRAQLLHERTAVSADTWRTQHFVEYYSLGDVVRMEHLVDTSNNTYRALRFLDPQVGNMLYAEYTDLNDWNFARPMEQLFHELFDLDQDPYQLKNIYDSASDETKKNLHDKVTAIWKCKGTECP